MTSPNTLHTPEQTQVARQTFELIDGLEPERNTAFTAVDQIGGTALAKLFLEGYSDHIATHSDEPIEDPLRTAMANISYVAGYMVTGNDPHKTAGEQHKEIMRPWVKAHEELTKQD